MVRIVFLVETIRATSISPQPESRVQGYGTILSQEDRIDRSSIDARYDLQGIELSLSKLLFMPLLPCGIFHNLIEYENITFLGNNQGKYCIFAQIQYHLKHTSDQCLGLIRWGKGRRGISPQQEGVMPTIWTLLDPKSAGFPETQHCPYIRSH